MISPQGFQLQLIPVTFSVTLTTSVIQQPQTINLIKGIVLERAPAWYRCTLDGLSETNVEVALFSIFSRKTLLFFLF